MKMTAKERFLLAIKLAHKVEHKLVAKAAIYGHLTYYGLVSFEAHGKTYAVVAGFIGVVMLLETLIGEPPGGDE